MLEELQHEKIIVGMKQVSRGVRESNTVQKVFLAQDADRHMIEKVSTLAEAYEVEIIPVESRKKLGKMCGIDVGATVVAVLK